MESLLGRNKTRHYDLVIGATLPTAGWRLLVAVSGITDQLPKKSTCLTSYTVLEHSLSSLGTSCLSV